MSQDASFFRVCLMSASLGVATLFGCFAPELPSGQFKCDQPSDVCPDNMQCVSGVCQSRVDDPTAPPAIDMSMTPTPMPTKGCSGTGVLLASVGGKDAHACAGSFPGPSGGATVLCATGYHLCKSRDSALLMDARANGRCDGPQLGGFFAADVLAGYDASGTLICDPKVAVTTAALVGCGSEVGSRSLDPSCQDLLTAAPCDGTVNGWTCTTNLGTATHAAGKGGGVLCCQD